MNASYAIFVGYGRKGVTSRDRNDRSDDLALDNLRILGNIRENRYFHLGEDLMRQ